MSHRHPACDRPQAGRLSGIILLAILRELESVLAKEKLCPAHLQETVTSWAQWHG